jgi:SAM-dependent methyltransferase
MNQPPDGSDLVRVPCPHCRGRRTRPERTVRGFALERCLGCGFVFTNPQYTPERIVREYEEHPAADELIGHYARVTTPEVRAAYDRILRGVEALLPGRGRLLDFGCAAGYFVERAAGRGWEAHGLDAGRWTAQAAAARAVTNIHIGLLADRIFDEGAFDAVHTSQVLEHLPSPTDDLAELRRVLRPGGVFYANVPNYRCLATVLGRDDFELNYPMAHLNYFTPGSLARMVRAAGFEVVRTSTYGGLKWENLLGRPIASDRTRALAAAAADPAPPPEARPEAAVVRRPLWKRLAYPVVDATLYRWAQVGMSLEIFARRPASS